MKTKMTLEQRPVKHLRWKQRKREHKSLYRKGKRAILVSAPR